jgi:predicted nuclease of restriction endonuclease-like (RecB) superfamily
MRYCTLVPNGVILNEVAYSVFLMSLIPTQQLFSDIKKLINEARSNIVRTVNQEMTLLYWHIGKRIKTEILNLEKPSYGEQIIVSLAVQLSVEYGKGFSKSNIFEMVRCYEQFSDLEIFQTLSGKLSWSHFLALLPIKNQQALNFYSYMCMHDKWSVRQLRSNIHRMLFECSAISRKSDEEIEQALLVLKNDHTFDIDLVLKDPYVVDFLNLPKDYYEHELEEAILQEIEQFILELGVGFSFVARQKRITIDGDHFYIDLLFYNRRLKRLVVVELKTGKFKAEYVGQMQLYLGWLKQFEVLEGENPPIGIILCTEKSSHQIELLEIDKSSIHVAEYWTELPPPDVFERKIREIVNRSKERMAILQATTPKEPDL